MLRGNPRRITCAYHVIITRSCSSFLVPVISATHHPQFQLSKTALVQGSAHAPQSCIYIARGRHSQVAVYLPFLDFFPALSFLTRPAFTGGSYPAMLCGRGFAPRTVSCHRGVACRRNLEIAHGYTMPTPSVYCCCPNVAT